MAEDRSIRYRFDFDDGNRREFAIQLLEPGWDASTPPNRQLHTKDEWTRLEFRQCPNCPLEPEIHPRCPVAVQLAPVLEAFAECLSYAMADVTVTSPNRTYHKRCPVQEGLSSLMGLMMVTAGCPILDKLRPMVFTHLPFARAEETIYRAVSTYLLAQYLLSRRGRKPDWELRDLVRLYEDIRTVNRAFTDRMAAVLREDAGSNALVKLDCSAEIACFHITKNWWKDFEPVFEKMLGECREDPTLERSS